MGSSGLSLELRDAIDVVPMLGVSAALGVTGIGLRPQAETVARGRKANAKYVCLRLDQVDGSRLFGGIQLQAAVLHSRQPAIAVVHY